MTSEEYGQYIDDFELGADVMPGESLTDYIERRRREFDSKADGGVIGIEVKIADEMAKGGRVGLFSGGALKGLANLFKRKGDDVVEIAKQEEIFREGPITTDFLNKVDDSIVSKFVRTRDSKGVGSYGMYDNFDDMPAGLKAAEIIKRFVNRKTGEINYDAAEFFIGRKLKGNETIDELIDIAIREPIGTGKGPLKDFEEYVLNPAKKADGGRVGLFMGGPALEGQALNIYNSMNAYGFTDQQIADALSAQGLYTPAGSGTGTETTQPNIIGAQLNQGGDKPMIQSFKKDPRVSPAFEAFQTDQQLKSMGIDNPFANEASLEGAYYGDMMDNIVTDKKYSPGKQSMLSKGIGTIKGLMDNPLFNLVGTAINPVGGAIKGIASFANQMLPVNKRAIAENIGGNMGIAVDDIGRIVNTGNYNDPDNVMAGYNLNMLTDKSFDKRIDTISGTLADKYGLGANEIKGILEGTLTDEELANINAKAIMPGTKKTTNLIKQLRSINIAKEKNKFIQEAAQKEAERKELAKQLAAAQKEIAAKGYQDYGSGGASAETMASYEAPDGSYAGASTQDYGGGEKDGGIIGYRKGGLATMFTRRR